MNYSGLTSISFRKLGYSEIIQLAMKSGLNGIEWGGDVHVPVNNADIAKAVYQDTKAAGLQVLSYGSYFRVGECQNVQQEFSDVLNTAVILNAPIIRIWAGAKGSAECDEKYVQKVLADTITVCNMAKPYHITVSFEYHRRTLTDTADSALKILKQSACENLKTYWQPNPDITHEENLLELEMVLPYLEHIHVFHWSKTERLDLKAGIAEWQDYLHVIQQDKKSHAYILEFFKGDNTEQFDKDSKTLQNLLK